MMPAELKELAGRGTLRVMANARVTMRVWRGDNSSGDYRDYDVDAEEGMVVLDVIHRIQATHSPGPGGPLGAKPGRCGSCSAEVEAIRPRLMCMTRMNTFVPGVPITVGADADLPRS